jgi:hypothetical protein
VLDSLAKESGEKKQTKGVDTYIGNKIGRRIKLRKRGRKGEGGRGGGKG